MAMLQLDPLIPMTTPKGDGMAHIVIDMGVEHHLQWVVFINETGECWVFDNLDIRIQDNLTKGRLPKEHQWRSCWEERQ